MCKMGVEEGEKVYFNYRPRASDEIIGPNNNNIGFDNSRLTFLALIIYYKTYKAIFDNDICQKSNKLLNLSSRIILQRIIFAQFLDLIIGKKGTD